MVKQQELDSFDRELAADNAVLRAEYPKSTKSLLAEEVHEMSQHTTHNKSEPASRWMREGRIFTARHKNLDRYPAFQFRDGLPHPAIARVLDALPNDMSPWETALWFVSPNGWLGNAAPKDTLNDEKAILLAAKRFGEETIG